jgi:hypothetical protein
LLAKAKSKEGFGAEYDDSAEQLLRQGEKSVVDIAHWEVSH